MTELRFCTKEDYERVGLGDSFDEISSITNYNELCIDNWSGFTLSEKNLNLSVQSNK